MHARTPRRSGQASRQVAQRARSADPVEFFNVLTSPELIEITEEHLPEHRERLYPPTVTLAMFITQALSADGSCQDVVNAWLARRSAEGLRDHSARTAGYCKARSRLPQTMVSELVRYTGRSMSEQAAMSWRWCGRSVKLMDGTTVSMPDTPLNQARYPQSARQLEGVGFPLARMVGVICLSSGAILDAALGACVGEGGSELALMRQLYGAFNPGDVALGDALYCNYFLIAALQRRGVDVLFEQQGGRRTDFRRGQSLGEDDHVVSWSRPRRPQWMSEEDYAALPHELQLRETRVGGRVLVTTMMNPKKVSKQELLELYQRRWHVELDLRNIKSTLGMQLLSCRTPQMVEKEMWVFLLAYNLIRLLMAQAAARSGVHPRELSFKHTLQLWTHWRAYGLLSEQAHLDALLHYIATHPTGHRSARREPRARKRRPQAYPLLQVPRAQARAKLRRAAA